MMGRDKDTEILSESNGGGYILLHRKLFDNKHYFSQPFTKSSAWIDLLLLANYHESYFDVRGIEVHVNRGQLAYSQKTLARRWRWSINRVKRYLHGLKIDTQIDYQNTNVTTLITVLNYDTYQNVNSQTNPQTRTKREPNGLHTNKDNKEKNIISSDFEDFWNLYDKKIGKEKCKPKWLKLSNEDKQAILEYIPKYKLAQPEKQFRKNPETFLDNRSWQDELILSDSPKKQSEQRAAITPQSSMDAYARAGIGSLRN